MTLSEWTSRFDGTDKITLQEPVDVQQILGFVVLRAWSGTRSMNMDAWPDEAEAAMPARRLGAIVVHRYGGRPRLATGDAANHAAKGNA